MKGVWEVFRVSVKVTLSYGIHWAIGMGFWLVGKEELNAFQLFICDNNTTRCARQLCFGLATSMTACE